MTRTELDLELSAGLSAPSTARAAVAREFTDSVSAEQLMDMRLAVASLINNSVRSKDAGPIRLRVWEEDGVIRGEV
jgi:hypothetical protein